MILSGMVVSTLLWANPRSAYVWIVLFVTLGFGAIGFYDDYLKVTKQSHNGFSGRSRLAGEAVIAIVAAYFMMCASATAPVTSLGDFFHAFVAPFNASAPATKLAAPFIHGWIVDLCLDLPALRRFRYRRRRQCGQSHRRPRRPRHRAGHDRRGDLRHHRLSRRQ